MKTTGNYAKYWIGPALALGALTIGIALRDYFGHRPASLVFVDQAKPSTPASQPSSSSTPLLSYSAPSGANKPANARVPEVYGKLPLSFEANHGRTDDEVKFLSRGSGYSLFLTSTETVLVLDRGTAVERGRKREMASPALRMKLVGANPQPQVTGLEELPGKVNYFIGDDPAKWRTGILTYAKVKYQDVYPGVDLVYYGNQRQLEFDFILAPGSDPAVVRLAFQGAHKLEIDAQGDLAVHAGGGKLRLRKPFIYQEGDGLRREIAGGYLLQGKQAGFAVTDYDRSKPLIIDPVVLSYATLLGGKDDDAGANIAVDTAGNAYLTGVTFSINFPATPSAFQTSYHDESAFSHDFGGDVFVTKINPQGSALVYSTYLGGAGNERSRSIAVDAGGNAYVAGTASRFFPITPGVLQPSFHPPLPPAPLTRQMAS